MIRNYCGLFLTFSLVLYQAADLHAVAPAKRKAAAKAEKSEKNERLKAVGIILAAGAGVAGLIAMGTLVNKQRALWQADSVLRDVLDNPLINASNQAENELSSAVRRRFPTSPYWLVDGVEEISGLNQRASRLAKRLGEMTWVPARFWRSGHTDRMRSNLSQNSSRLEGVMGMLHDDENYRAQEITRREEHAKLERARAKAVNLKQTVHVSTRNDGTSIH